MSTDTKSLESLIRAKAIREMRERVQAAFKVAKAAMNHRGSVDVAFYSQNFWMGQSALRKPVEGSDRPTEIKVTAHLHIGIDWIMEEAMKAMETDVGDKAVAEFLQRMDSLQNEIEALRSDAGL